MCTFCRSLNSPEMEYNCDDDPPNRKDKNAPGLSAEDQRVSFCLSLSQTHTHLDYTLIDCFHN